MPAIGTPDRYRHEAGDHEVETSGEDGVVEGLAIGMVDLWFDGERTSCTSAEPDQCEGRYVPGKTSELMLKIRRVQYQPIIVIGCAIENRTLRAMFNRRKRFDIRAMTSWAALMPISLHTK